MSFRYNIAPIGSQSFFKTLTVAMSFLNTAEDKTLKKHSYWFQVHFTE